MKFRTKQQGMNTRKHLWVCLDCNYSWNKKLKACPVCGSRQYHYFPSKAEAKRYWQLRFLQDLNQISGLILQPVFPCAIGGKLVTTYKADFQYVDADGGTVVEDVKGLETDVFKLKKNLVEVLHNIEIKIVRR